MVVFGLAAGFVVSRVASSEVEGSKGTSYKLPMVYSSLLLTIKQELCIVPDLRTNKVCGVFVV
jgi:hypothetical protein